MNSSILFKADRIVNNTFKAPLTRILTYQELTSEERVVLRKIELIRKSIDHKASHYLIDWLQTDPIRIKNYGHLDVMCLEHYLSSYLIQESNPVGNAHSSLDEMNIVKRLRSNFTDGDPINLLLAIRKLAYLIIGSETFRDKQVGTCLDKSNSRVIYPDAELVSDQLQRLHFMISQSYEISPSYCAVLALVVITNAHPFMDANGRISRIIFNWLMAYSDDNSYYLPLFEVAALSNKGFTIRLRHAQYHGKWLELLLFILYIHESFIG